MADPVKLTVEFKNVHPIELTDLTQSLLAFADEYKRYLARDEEPTVADDVRLYVKEIRPGSIVADLVAMAPYALPFVENANHIFKFLGYLKTAYDYLLGESDEKPQLERNNYLNLTNILEPVAKDNGSYLNVGAIHVTTGPITVNINSMKANAIQNAANRELAALKAPTTGMHEKVLLYWFQARNDPKSKTGDKAIIESLHKGPVKALFVNESIKAKILSASENPFTMAYVVDVAVETIKEKPALYRILEMYDVLERNEMI